MNRGHGCRQVLQCVRALLLVVSLLIVVSLCRVRHLRREKEVSVPCVKESHVELFLEEKLLMNFLLTLFELHF